MNNLLQKYYSKKATIVNRSFFIIALFTSVLSNSFSQEIEVRHYQRKCSMDSIILPGQVYDSKFYSIPFPDSLYTAGTITVKKLRINKIKYEVKFNISENRYTKLYYTFPKRHKEKAMNMITMNNRSYSYELKKHRRRYIMILSPKSD